MRLPIQRWHVLRRVERQAVHMDRVMDQLPAGVGMAVRKSGGSAYLEARRACAFCAFDKRCHQWIEEHPEPAQPPAFCPNARFFSEFI